MSLFVHKDTEELHPRTLELMEEVAKRVEVDGIQAWWDLDAKEILGDEADQYVKVPDTLDVWFDSGSTHSSVVDVRPEFAGHAADMYLEGSDQHRGWFMSSLMISTAMKGKAPYRQVLTHGFTVDGQGRKMSKSIGNTVSPQDVMNKLGADILRLWVASTDYTGEMAVSDEILKRAADSYRRIRNTARFLLANLNGFDPAKDMVKPEEMVVLDRWAVGCAKAAQEDILKAYEAYDFHEVVQRLMRFCSVEMGSFYLDIIKDRQYTAKADSVARRSCQTALYHIAEALVRWMAPILSFTADEVWGYLPGEREKYVFTGEWYEGLFGLADSEAMNDAFWDELLKVRGEVNKVIEQARADKKVGGSLEAAVTLYAEPELAAKLTALGDELRFVLLTSGATVADYNDAPADAQQSEVLKGLKVALSKAEGEKCPRCWHYTRMSARWRNTQKSAAAVSATSPVTVKNVSLPDESIDLFNRATLAVAGGSRADYRSGQQIPDPPELCSGDTVPLFPSLNLHYARNYGAAFSFLADSGGWQRWFFAGIAIGISVILVVMMYRSKAAQKLNNIAYALIIGGALGNLFDRLWHGFVVDMIDFYVGDWHFATFNLADTAICVGAALIVLEGFYLLKRKTIINPAGCDADASYPAYRLLRNRRPHPAKILKI